MNFRTFFVSAVVLACQSMSEAGVKVGPTFSGGEIQNQDGFDMMRTMGIYEYGASLSFEKEYWEANLQLEGGYYKQSPSYGAGMDFNGKYGFYDDGLKLYAGLGFAYNGFIQDKWRLPNSMEAEFSHTYSPYLSTRVELFQKLRLGFEGLFDSRIFWKARVGWVLLDFE